jgi:hypothetical protein
MQKYLWKGYYLLNKNKRTENKADRKSNIKAS